MGDTQPPRGARPGYETARVSRDSMAGGANTGSAAVSVADAAWDSVSAEGFEGSDGFGGLGGFDGLVCLTGATTMVIRRPSVRGGLSTFASSPNSSRMLWNTIKPTF